jgi:hypothetical protein
MIMDHDYCMWLYESHRHRLCENGNSLCLETHKRLCSFKKTCDREFSNVSKVHCALSFLLKI